MLLALSLSPSLLIHPLTAEGGWGRDRKLRHAAWKGDITLAANLLDRGIDIEGTDADGAPQAAMLPLQRSNFLAGAPISTRRPPPRCRPAGFTPVLIAARWDRLEMLRFLLDRGGASRRRDRHSADALSLHPY